MSKHVQNTDASVLERRLRPIYDWLDAGNNKKALQECDKVLKKTRNLHCARALKALALIRMNRENESNMILDSIVDEKPVEESTLQAMSLCYRETQQLDKVCQLYETAVESEPNNEELLTHLFMSYVRTNNFKAQQQAAIVLYKQKPKNPYYCWNVMSIVLRATKGEESNDNEKRKIFLNLAERMMEKVIDENKVYAEQEIQLYIIILQILKKYDKILQVLNSPLEEILSTTNVVQLKIDIWKKLKMWSSINSVCKNILNESCQKWDVWLDYIESVIHLAEDVNRVNGDALNDVENNLNSVDNTAEKCHEFICSIIESKQSNDFLLRAPYLARFELCWKLKTIHIKTEDILGDKIELFIEYFRKFGHKSCIVSDLRIYLKLLDDAQKSDLAVKIIKDVGIGGTSVPQTADQMQRHINALQLSRLCGGHNNLTTDHLVALVTVLALHYQHGYQVYGKDLQSTDMGPSDNYAILATHVLYDLSYKLNETDSLIRAVILLESLLKNTPSNFHAKLLLIKFYHILGAGIEANTAFYYLDIKHLQVDSLGYIHCARLATTGLYSLCSVHYDATLKFFSTHFKESTEHLIYSYKFGSFIKLDEFMDFREKINNSLHYRMTVMDRIFLGILECNSLSNTPNIETYCKENKIEWEKLRDNRDLDVYKCWDGEFSSQSLEIKKLFKQDINFLKLRTHLLSVLNAAVEVSKSRHDNRQVHLEHMNRILKEWKQLEELLPNIVDLSPISQQSVAYPMPSRLHGFRDIPYLEIVTVFLEFLECLVQENTGNLEMKSKAATDVLINLCKNLEKLDNDSSDFRKKRKGLEMIVNTVEVLCISCFITILCNESIQSTGSKKNKKKQQTITESKTSLLTIVNQLKTEIDKLKEFTTNWCCKWEERNLEDTFHSLNLNDIGFSVCKTITDSYESSNKEIQNLLSDKLKLLNSCFK